jgi:hypothetical protein
MLFHPALQCFPSWLHISFHWVKPRKTWPKKTQAHQTQQLCFLYGISECICKVVHISDITEQHSLIAYLCDALYPSVVRSLSTLEVQLSLQGNTAMLLNLHQYHTAAAEFESSALTNAKTTASDQIGLPDSPAKSGKCRHQSGTGMTCDITHAIPTGMGP